MLDTGTLDELKKIIFRYIDREKYAVFLFGSRVSGKNKKYSDIDVGIEGEKALDFLTISRIQNDLEESDIPYTVDLVDFTKVSDRFRSIAKQNSMSIN